MIIFENIEIIKYKYDTNSCERKGRTEPNINWNKRGGKSTGTHTGSEMG